MRDIDGIRRDNLRIIEVEAGSPTVAAESINMSLTQFINLRDGAKDSRTGKPRGMRKETARKIEEARNKPPGWLDTDHSGESFTHASRVLTSRFDVLDVTAACGPGAVNVDYPEIIHRLEMPPEEARRLIGRTNTDDVVKIIRSTHDSMVPTIQPDDLLFVDASIRTFNGEGVYLLLHGGELICKRLTYVGRALTVISDNTHYPSWAWEERLDETQIVGKVLRALPMDMKNFGE